MSVEFHKIGKIFHLWDQFSWNVSFNIEYVLLGRNFAFLGGYLVVTAVYLVVLLRTACFLSVTARYRSFLLVPTFSMIGKLLIVQR